MAMIYKDGFAQIFLPFRFSLDNIFLLGRIEPGRVSAQVIGEEFIDCRSEAMQRVMELTERVAPSTASVLMTGESGAGKDFVAQIIHTRSPRASAAFIAVSCPAIPEMLLESELFGHQRGSFTGAVTDRAGLFEHAAGGTLFLDEI